MRRLRSAFTRIVPQLAAESVKKSKKTLKSNESPDSLHTAGISSSSTKASVSSRVPSNLSHIFIDSALNQRRSNIVRMTGLGID